MAERIALRRSRRRFESSDDESEAPSEPKRRRRDGSMDFDESSSEVSGSLVRRTNLRNYPAGASDERPATTDREFQPGAIVRVVLDNFVTYEHVVVSPGPNLNMVIGPNGTGKSSLVCAFCLGLGYSPNILGRAGKVSEYVKIGKASATVQIELQKSPGQRRNPLIKLRITREDNGRKWWLNGRECKLKDVEEVVQNAKIQIDNLCQFLPQDRVVEFAGLTPVQLLNETLRAAAPREMLEWRDRLSLLHDQEKVLQEKLVSSDRSIENLQNRQLAQQADVERFREREEIQKLIDDLKCARMYAEYHTAVEGLKAARDQKKTAEQKLTRLQAALGPAMEAVNQHEEYQQGLEAALANRKALERTTEIAVERLLADIDAAEGQLQQLSLQRTGEEELRRRLNQDVQKIKARIAGLEAQQRQPKPDFDPVSWNQKIREKEHRQRDIETERRELQEQAAAVTQEGRRINASRKNTERELASLDSQQGQQLSMIRKNHPDIAKGWEWIQQNRSEFEKEVFGPPALNCSVKDEAYSDLVQALLKRDDFLCFVTQTQGDHKKLTEQLYKVMKLKASIRTCTQPLESFRTRFSKERIQQLGLDGVAIDYIDGPSPVLAMLCARHRLHLAGVALQDISAEQYNVLSNDERISTWATGKSLYQVQRRRDLGPDVSSTSTTTVRPGNYWKTQAVDSREKAELTQRLEEEKAKLEELKDDLKTIKTKMEDLDRAEEAARHELEELRRQKNELQKEFNKWMGIPDKLEHENKLLADKLSEMENTRRRISELGVEHDERLVARAKTVLLYVQQVSRLRSVHEDTLDVNLRLVEAVSDVAALKGQNAGFSQLLKQEQTNVRELTGREADLKRRRKALWEELLRVAQATGEANADERHSRFQQLSSGKTVADINNEIGAEEAKLELIHAADPNILTEHTRRARQIASARAAQAETRVAVEALQQEHQEIREQWEPRLDALVNEISAAFAYNFEQINCRGEVVVDKAGDFNEWAIQIRVSFRPSEELQKLDQHRQSGGERAVSTIFYLMSLQRMAQAPFRVVDEINQGMDPRNERMVHERMVDIACREHTSQYFLITPKLLTGLRYDPRMTVLCITSGGGVDERVGQTDVGKMVQTLRTLRAAA